MTYLKYVLISSFFLSSVSNAADIVSPVNPDPGTSSTTQTTVTTTTTTEVVIDDNLITAQVAEKLTLNPILSAYSIGISTIDGVVYLNGALTNEEQYANAISIAKSVKGVKKVDASKLSIQILQGEQSDVALTALIKGNLVRGGAFGSTDHITWPIRISSNNGSVLVTGVVPTEEQKALILNIVAATEGVKYVDEDIEVRIPDER